MSIHEYVSRSGYVEDAYPDHAQEFPAFSAEGKRRPVISYGRTYVIESHVEEIRRGRAIYPSSHSKGLPLKVTEPFKSYGRPPEVHDLLTKILTEVNGPPHKTHQGTNQGRHYFAPGPPPTNSDPNVGRVEWSRADHKYGTSPTKVGPASVPTAKATDPNPGYRANHGYRYGSYPTKVDPTKGYGYDSDYISSPVKGERTPPSHQWGRSSSHVHDRPRPVDYSAPYPNHQWGGYGVDSESEAPRSSSPIYDHPSERNYQIPKEQWSTPLKPQTWDYGVADNSSPRKPSLPRDYDVHKDGWSGSPMKSQAPYEFEVHPDNHSKPENPIDYRDQRWGKSPLNPETQYYGVPNNKWNKPVVSADDNPQKNLGKQLGGSTMKAHIPDNPSSPVVKTESPKGYGIPNNRWESSSSPAHDHLQKNPSSPKNQWGSLPVQKQIPKDYGVSSNQQDRSLSPVYDYPQNNPSKNRWEGSSMEKQSPRGYGVPNNHPSSLVHDHPSSPKNQRGSLPVKKQSPKDYGVSSNQHDRSLSPVYHNPQNNPSKNRWDDSSLEKQSPRGYGVSNNHPSSLVHDHSSIPKNQLGGLPLKKQSFKDYGISSNQWDRSSSPVSDHPQNNPSMNRWGGSSLEKDSPRSYQVPNNQSSSLARDLLQNNPSKDQWGNSGMETEGHGVPNNQWDRSSNLIYDDSADEGHHKPPQGTYDEPRRGNTHSLPVKPVSYSDDHQHDNEGGWQSSSNDKPKDLGRSINQTKPSGYNNMDGALKKLSLETPAAPVATPPSGSNKFTVPPPVRLKPEVAIDSTEASRIYGARNLPAKPYAGGEDQKSSISSKEALERYNGSIVPK